METPVHSGAVVLLACLGMLPLAMVLRRRAKSGAASPRPASITWAFAASAAFAAAGLALALH